MPKLTGLNSPNDICVFSSIVKFSIALFIRFNSLSGVFDLTAFINISIRLASLVSSLFLHEVSTASFSPIEIKISSAEFVSSLFSIKIGWARKSISVSNRSFENMPAISLCFCMESSFL
ncbi:MAG: hypothetical protein ACD_37C00480G0001 [uncultured bacterium]|nr:MAG: hypothetical protein ACD_37C00480G0001 [uncultured bacterium]